MARNDPYYIALQLDDLFTRLNNFLRHPTTPDKDADFGLFLMENSGLLFNADTDLSQLRWVYQPFWAALTQLAQVRPDAVSRLPWPPTPKTAYRHATYIIYSGRYRPTVSGILEEWATLNADASGGDITREVSARTIDLIEEAIEITEERAEAAGDIAAWTTRREGAPPTPLERPSVARKTFDLVYGNFEIKKWFNTTMDLLETVIEDAEPTLGGRRLASKRVATPSLALTGHCEAPIPHKCDRPHGDDAGPDNKPAPSRPIGHDQFVFQPPLD